MIKPRRPERSFSEADLMGSFRLSFLATIVN